MYYIPISHYKNYINVCTNTFNMRHFYLLSIMFYKYRKLFHYITNYNFLVFIISCNMCISILASIFWSLIFLKITFTTLQLTVILSFTIKHKLILNCITPTVICIRPYVLNLPKLCLKHDTFDRFVPLRNIYNKAL